jgi:1,4-alpha-glucan branching enzyme
VLSGRESAGFGRRHGAALPASFAGERLTVFAQNHDQIGNAGFGARLAASLPIEAQFAIAAIVLLAPFVPLRFMGEEYGETAPFHYFTSHSDAGLVEAVRSGRAEEVGSHLLGPPPDPQDPETFAACHPERRLASSGIHAELLEWQRDLLGIRRAYCAFGTLEPGRTTAVGDAATSTLTVVRAAESYLDAPDTALVCRLGPSGGAVQPDLLAGRAWRVLASRGCTLPGGGDVVCCTDDRDTQIVLAGYGVAVLVAEPRSPVA